MRQRQITAKYAQVPKRRRKYNSASHSRGVRSPCRQGLAPGADMTRRYIRFFDEIGIEDVPLVGGKNASLGEMYRNLSSQGVKVPNGFAITAEAYRYLLEQARALGPLHETLDDFRADDVPELSRR